VLDEQLLPLGSTSVRILDNKGCAFADFDSWASAERAVSALNGLKLTSECTEGITVKFADSRNAPKGREGQPKVFIGGLGHSSTEEALYALGAKYGRVVEAKIYAKRPDAPPCGFLLYSTVQEAEHCIQGLHGADVDICAPGKSLNVKMADTTAKSLSEAASVPAVADNIYHSFTSHLYSTAGVSGMGSVTNSLGVPSLLPPPTTLSAQRSIPSIASLVAMGGYTNSVAGRTRAAGSRPSTGGPGAAPPPAGCSPKLFIGGLPEEASEDFIWGLMSPYGEVIEAKIHRRVGSQPCGFVRYATPGEADFAIASFEHMSKFTVQLADESRGAKRNFDSAFDTTGMY
jgi:hypothetical protein